MSKLISIHGGLRDNANKLFRLESRLYHIIHRNTDVKSYPIVINNFNRLEWLQQQVEWLRRIGQRNIHIIDNRSTYQPLLHYYKKVPATVYMLDKNIGHEAFWRTHIHQRLGKFYHVYTDPDVLPTEDTPDDFMYYFKGILDRHPAIQKVGFGLCTNDIPDHYTKKQEVIAWESAIDQQPVESNVFKSKIDTTFALYRPGAAYQCWDQTLRTGAPYKLRHMPWYENPAALNEESKFYAEAASASSSWYKAVAGENHDY